MGFFGYPIEDQYQQSILITSSGEVSLALFLRGYVTLTFRSFYGPLRTFDIGIRLRQSGTTFNSTLASYQTYVPSTPS